MKWWDRMPWSSFPECWIPIQALDYCSLTNGKGFRTFSLQHILQWGQIKWRYSLSTWDTKVEQFLSCVEGLFCLKNGTQSINCGHATKEKGRLSLFDTIREFGSVKRYRWADCKGERKRRDNVLLQGMYSFPSTLKKKKNSQKKKKSNLSQEWLATGNVMIAPSQHPAQIHVFGDHMLHVGSMS